MCLCLCYPYFPPLHRRSPMPLFEVPDWNAPSSVQSTKPIKKRKRSAYDEEVRLGEADFNFEKLVKQLEGGSTSSKEKKKAHVESNRSEKKTERISSNADRHPESKKEKKAKKKSTKKPSKLSEDNKTTPSRKKRKKENKSEQTQAVTEDEPKPPTLSEKSKSSKQSGLTPLQSKMKATLDGARFRYVLPQVWSINYR